MVDFQEILNYGWRSQLTYFVTQPAWSMTEEVGWRDSNNVRLQIEDVTDAEVNVIVESHDDKKIQWIAVRGSSNLRNWVLNFQYLQHDVEQNEASGKVEIDFHSGFYQAAQDVYRVIKPHLNQGYTTRITGHSLGGAIATILMVLLTGDEYQIEKCITFGQPRVTNKKGAEQLTGLPLLRIINEEDVVPLVPPTTILTLLKGGYEHFGPEIHLRPGSYKYYPNPEVPENHSDSFWANLVDALAKEDISHSTDNIKDHFMANYLSHIMSNMEKPSPKLKMLLSMSD